MKAQERPFYLDPWKGEHLEAARSLWDWHMELRDVAVNGGRAAVEFDREADQVRSSLRTSLVSEKVNARFRDTALRFNLGVDDLARQVSAAGCLVDAIQFRDFKEHREFVEAWIGPLARGLATIGGVSGRLHAPRVRALSEGYFLLGCILDLSEDISRGHAFIPQSEMEAFAVTPAQLTQSPPDDQVKKLLWKQCVRIRDSFAAALPLSKDLKRSYSVGFRRWWLGGLEMVNAVERRNYDVCSAPISLSPYHRAQARFQARFARVSFGHK